jgi:hypothetical protein
MPYSAEYMARVTHTLCLRGTLELWQELMPLQVMSLAELGGGAEGKLSAEMLTG